MHKVYHEKPRPERPHDQEKCEMVIFIILNYVLFCGAHIFGISYYFTYVVYEDAIANPNYNNKEITKDLSSSNLIAVFVVCFVILYLQQIYLSVKFTRHFLGVCMTTQVCTLLFAFSKLKGILSTGCKNRELLTCYESTEPATLDDSVIKYHTNVVVIAVASIAIAQTLYIIASMIQNKKRYFFSQRPWKEFISYYLYYLMLTCIVFILPVIICLAVIGGGGGGNGDCDLDCPCFSGTVTGNEPKVDTTFQTTPFGTRQVVNYGNDETRYQDV